MRNSDLVRRTETEVGRYDRSLWDAAKTKGDDAIHCSSTTVAPGASVTIVLIGRETFSQGRCRYKIEKSHLDAKGVLGLRIHTIRDDRRLSGTAGPDPFEYTKAEDDDRCVSSPAGLYPSYD